MQQYQPRHASERMDSLEILNGHPTKLLFAESEENQGPEGATPSPADEMSPSLTAPTTATPERRRAGRKAGKQVMACKCTTIHPWPQPTCFQSVLAT